MSVRMLTHYLDCSSENRKWLEMYKTNTEKKYRIPVMKADKNKSVAPKKLRIKVLSPN